jgi:hypothetical protein
MGAGALTGCAGAGTRAGWAPQGLKPFTHCTFDAGLKACSTHWERPEALQCRVHAKKRWRSLRV